MGVYSEYLDRNLTPQQLDTERKSWLKKVGELLGAEVITYAARMTSLPPLPLPVALVYDDLVPFNDVLKSLTGTDRVAVVLETPGGSGEVAQQLVEILHQRFKHVSFLVPGTAKSAGTIMVLGGHEILMGPDSSLGPIDAQISQQGGKQFSADALIEGFERVKKEVEETGKLNQAYIPILQQISPGEIQSAINALEFARVVTRDWLVKYKFANWTKHTSTGAPVTEDEKAKRAYEISSKLSSQKLWHTHGRSLRIPDLEALKLRITEFSATPGLPDAIERYFVLLRMTFDNGNVFKLFESATATIASRFNVNVSGGGGAAAAGVTGGLPPGVSPASVVIGHPCSQCRKLVQVQLDFEPGIKLQPGALRFPDSGLVKCPHCKTQVDFRPGRAEVERQAGRQALTPQPAK